MVKIASADQYVEYDCVCVFSQRVWSDAFMCPESFWKDMQETIKRGHLWEREQRVVSGRLRN